MTRAMPVPETATLHVPFRIVKRGGRKEMQMPPGAPAQRKADNSLIKALARAFRWRALLESGDFLTVADLAQAEKISKSYLSCVLRLTMLAPDIVEAIVDARQPEEVTFDLMRRPFPADWKEQRQRFSSY